MDTKEKLLKVPFQVLSQTNIQLKNNSITGFRFFIIPHFKSTDYWLHIHNQISVSFHHLQSSAYLCTLLTYNALSSLRLPSTCLQLCPTVLASLTIISMPPSTQYGTTSHSLSAWSLPCPHLKAYFYSVACHELS